MTERFSPEYIAFILSDEAKVLQGKWDPGYANVGDWIHSKLGTGGPGLITGVSRHGPPENPIENVELTVNCGRYKYKHRGEYGNIKSWYWWLPTLTDLLGMIEEAAIVDTGIHYDPALNEWYAIQGGHIVASETDKLLAAAKLAVRVLTKGEDG